MIALYRQMARVRAFEETQAALWEEGRISGEMHLVTGEEALTAGVCMHLRSGDAVALDHRPTGVMVAIGVDPAAMLKEMMGAPDGLDGGRAGQMHLMARAHLAAASGIVGSAGPMAAGFALAAKRLRPGHVAAAFFGDGAMNQGMLLESFNLAAAWSLPVLFVLKDNGWAITTRTASVSAGDFSKRAEAFGLPVADVDGLDASLVHRAAGVAIERIRSGAGPSFLRARVSRLDGHFLGDPLVRSATKPTRQDREKLTPVVNALLAREGGGIATRVASVAHMIQLARRARQSGRGTLDDPLERARQRIDKTNAQRCDEEAEREMHQALEAAMQGGQP
jgi:pyruvate dehydrogenase E1 component alpha subunit